jgi:purine-binding chemotaxis protein CheW
MFSCSEGEKGLYVVLCLDDMRVALALPCVERVVRAVYLTPLPAAPEIVTGVVNVQGQIIPSVNMRRRFRLPEREIALTDQLVMARTRHRSVVLVVDAVSDIIECTKSDIVEAENILPGLEYINGIVKLSEGLILIHNLDRFLSLEEEESLDRAMAACEGE